MWQSDAIKSQLCGLNLIFMKKRLVLGTVVVVVVFRSVIMWMFSFRSEYIFWKSTLQKHSCDYEMCHFWYQPHSAHWQMRRMLSLSLFGININGETANALLVWDALAGRLELAAASHISLWSPSQREFVTVFWYQKK